MPENEHDPDDAGAPVGGLEPISVDTSSTVAFAPGRVSFIIPVTLFLAAVAMEEAALLFELMAASDVVTTWRLASRDALLSAWLRDRPGN